MYITIFNGNELIFQFKYEEEDILWQPLHQSDSSFSWTDKWSQLRTAQYTYNVEHLQSLVKALLQKLFLTTMSISADFFSQTFQCFQYSQTFQRLYLPRSQRWCNLWHCHRHFLYINILLQSQLDLFWSHLSLVRFTGLLGKQVARETWLIYPQRPHINNPNQDLKNHEHFFNEHK